MLQPHVTQQHPCDNGLHKGDKHCPGAPLDGVGYIVLMTLFGIILYYYNKK